MPVHFKCRCIEALKILSSLYVHEGLAAALKKSTSFLNAERDAMECLVMTVTC